MNTAILLISCPDQRGITASVTGFISEHGGNIIHADQHIDDQRNIFFMRLVWALDGFDLSVEDIKTRFGAIAEKWKMQWQLSLSTKKDRMVIFVSRHLHCLYDLLYRHRAGQFNADIVGIVSNHPDARTLAEGMGIPYQEFVMLKENKLEQEKAQIALLQAWQVDVIVLARYHQILSPHFVDLYPQKIINIHHSFLPAFVGKDPYRQAYDKGVKVIGATSHYVTHELDQGPIIEQATVSISHRDSLSDIMRKGEDLEKAVLGRALRWHLEKKILTYGHKTVVFD